MKKSYASKISTILLALLLAVSAVCPATAAEFWKADTSWHDGAAAAKGTLVDPYRITDAEGLAGLAALVNAGSDDFKDKYVTLTLDVDLAQKEWIPIGWMVAYGNLSGFAGHFDGGGHKITGLLISTGDYLPKGTGGKIDKNGTVSNTAGLFGYLTATGTIQNVYIEGSVTNKVSQGAAGLVGWTDGYVYNCIASCDVDASGVGRSYAGVVASLLGGGMVRNCISYGTAKSTVGSAYSGGIAGYGYWYRGATENCVAMCSSLISTMDAGGIWGGFNSTTKYCVSTSDYVKGGSATYTGGIVGAFGYGFTECYWLYAKDSQPEFAWGGSGTDGRITDLAKLPVASVVLTTDSFKTLKTGETRVIEAASYPSTADASALKYNWTVADGLTIVSGAGTSKITVKADKDGLYPVSASVTGILGVDAARTDIALTPGGILKVTSKVIAVSEINISGNTEALAEGESRTFTAACKPSDAENQSVSWSVSATSGEAQDSNIALVKNADGSATVTLRRGSATASGYTLTATAADGGARASVIITTSIINGEDISSILPVGDVVTAGTEAVKANGINSSQLDELAKTLGVSMSSFKVNEKGIVYLVDAVVQTAIVNAISDDNIVLEKAVSMPIFKTQVSAAGATAVTAFIISGDKLMANTPQDIKLVKTRPDGTGVFLTYAAASSGYTDGHFTIQNMDDSVMAADGTIDASASYKLVVYVKDGGACDIDPTAGSIIDPLALIKTSQKQPSDGSGSSSGSSGCNGGFAAAALLAVLPVFRRRREK